MTGLEPIVFEHGGKDMTAVHACDASVGVASVIGIPLPIWSGADTISGPSRQRERRRTQAP